MNGDEPKNLLARDIARVVLATAIFAALLVLLRTDFVRHNVMEIDGVRAALQAEEERFGAIASRLVFVAAASALIGAGMPRIYASAVAGAVYGAAEGIPLAMLASLLGSTVSYQLGRSLLAGVVRRRVGGRFAVYREQCSRDPFWWVLFARLMPFANATLMNLLCGACRVPLRPFLLASAIGFLPLTIVFALFGSGGAKGSWTQIGVGAGCLLLSVALRPLCRTRTSSPTPGIPSSAGTPRSDSSSLTRHT